jgi:PH (Pleckstrin Homology) domain-containing protein
MLETANFPPPRQRGLVSHGAIMAALAAIFVFCLWSVFQTEVGPEFSLYVLLTVVSFLPLPFLGYRAYALLRSDYLLNRNTLRIIWGLRVEDVPISDVEWLRSPAHLSEPLRLPRLRLPGAVLGRRVTPALGEVEFVASETGKLLLIATARRVFAISPDDPALFASSLQHAIEMGSLAPAPAQSQYPSFLLAEVWNNPAARYLLLAGIFLNAGLFGWVTAFIPRLELVPLGFSALLEPLGPVPATQLILLPTLSMLLFVTGTLAGLFFYRRPGERSLAFILWGAGAASALIFNIAVLILLTTPI